MKYNNEIPILNKKDSVIKGYYYTERELVNKIKKAVFPVKKANKELRTIECQIMDIADDIAYSTYDLEDAFKAEFLNPLDLVDIEESVAKKTASKINEKLNAHLEHRMQRLSRAGSIAALKNLLIKAALDGYSEGLVEVEKRFHRRYVYEDNSKNQGVV